MKERKVWSGDYRGVRYEINSYMMEGYRPEPCWTFYLHLLAEQFPEDVRPKLMTKTYFTQFGTPIEIYRGPMDSLEWHGGITWASNETKPNSVFTCLKFGCDYQHLFDENRFYDLAYVESEVKECIESLYKMYPEIKAHDQLWDEHRKKFPGEQAGDNRFFDVNGNKINYPFDDETASPISRL